MCGIAGMYCSEGLASEAEESVCRMLAALRHRGPDQAGLYVHPQCVLGSVRLSILDLSGGQQPICNESRTLWIVFNGEIFNSLELRKDLEARGHRFATHTDTETILHLYEELGPRCLKELNGQFAIAIWDETKQQLFLARDRLGERPLFHARAEDTILFASEIKALLASGLVEARLVPAAVAEVMIYWAPQGGRTAFEGVEEVSPGTFRTLGCDGASTGRYWEIDFPSDPAEDQGQREGSEEDQVTTLQALLQDATRLRLRADVPVGAYLSGGLDSSTVAALAGRLVGDRLDTFSIAFTDARFDESEHQRRVAAFLGTRHQTVLVAPEDIGRAFPQVTWHAEVPLARTAPVPLFLLARRVREHGYKVVLTGEGADEFFAGYDLFKEVKVRRFWARHPASRWRPILLRRLYADVLPSTAAKAPWLAEFFAYRLDETEAWDYSHCIRWHNNRRILRFLAPEVAEEAASRASLLSGPLPTSFAQWDWLARAQYLEITTFLTPYLLSSQGDRMAMAHGVEARMPFLDPRVVAFGNRLPPRSKLRGLREKHVLRLAARDWLPDWVCSRPKRPYRAPIQACFFPPQPLDYVEDLLSPVALRRTGFFRPEAVAHLVAKIRSGAPASETDEMALVVVLSTQLLDYQFVRAFRMPPPLPREAELLVRRATCVSDIA